MPNIVAIVNVERINSTNQLQVAARHNLREIASEISAHGHIDPARTHLNRILAGPTTAQGVMDLHRQLLDAVQPTPVRKDGSRAKMRHDTVVAVEVMVSVPPGAVDEATFFDDTLAWIDQRFGVPILSAVWHRDQGQGHVHCLLLPLKDGRMVGSGLAGRFDRMHDDFHAKVGQKHGLARKVRMDASSRKVGASMAMDALDANPALRYDPVVRAALQACIERDPGPLLQALGLIQERPPEKQWIETMTRPVTAPKPIGFDGDGPAAAPASHQVDDRTLSCVRVRHDPPPVDAHAGSAAAGDLGQADHAVEQVAPPGHHDSAHDVLAGEAWLVLPAWQVTATAYSDPTPQPTGPVHIMLDDGQLAEDDDGDDGDFIRVHDDQIPSNQWHDGQPMPLPPKPPSRRAQTVAAVQRALHLCPGHR